MLSPLRSYQQPVGRRWLEPKWVEPKWLEPNKQTFHSELTVQNEPNKQTNKHQNGIYNTIQHFKK